MEKKIRKKRWNKVFICSGIHQSSLFSMEIEAASEQEANSIFIDKNKFSPQIILGPLYKKREVAKIKDQAIENIDNVELSGPSRMAIYRDWVVLALPIQNSKDLAYLLFDHRLDNKKSIKPSPNIVNIKELKEYEKINY